MHSPPAEWTILIGSLAALDWVRSRGEADQDTLSEVVREAVYRHPLGPLAFTLGLYVGCEGLRRHILKAT